MEKGEIYQNECSEIISVITDLVGEICEEVRDIKDEDLVEPFKEIEPDEKFLDYMEVIEKKFFYLYITFKAKKQEIKMKKVEAALKLLASLRLIEKNVEFSARNINFRKGFKIVEKEEKITPYSKKID